MGLLADGPKVASRLAIATVSDAAIRQFPGIHTSVGSNRTYLRPEAALSPGAIALIRNEIAQGVPLN